MATKTGNTTSDIIGRQTDIAIREYDRSSEGARMVRRVADLVESAGNMPYRALLLRGARIGIAQFRIDLYLVRKGS